MERMEAKASQITRVQRRSGPAGETEDSEAEKELRAVRTSLHEGGNGSCLPSGITGATNKKNCTQMRHGERQEAPSIAEGRAHHAVRPEGWLRPGRLTVPGQGSDSDRLCLTSSLWTVYFPVPILSSVEINNKC